MTKLSRLLVLGTMMLLAVAIMTSPSLAKVFDEITDARNDLTRLAKLYADAHRTKGNVDAAKTKEIAEVMKKKYDDLNTIMVIYKPSKNKGISFNPEKQGPGDGIEKRFIDLARRKPLSNADLAKEKELLIRMAMFNLAMHEVLKEFGPKLKNGPAAKQWKKFNMEMKEGSESLLKAVTATDPVGLKKAAGKVNAACNDCHANFR